MLNDSTAAVCPQFAARMRARETRVSRALENYPEIYRQAVMRTAAQDTRLADLALSFPALLFVAAVPHTRVDRADLTAAVLAGRPLKTLAAMAGLPFWLRKLPPQAYDAPIGALPDGVFIQKQICNHLPKPARHAARWLSCVSFSMQWGQESFALWVATLAHQEKGRMNRKNLQKLALWAWASSRPETQLGQLCLKRWNARLSLKQAVGLCCDWVDQVNLHLLLQVRPHPPKFRAATIDGLDFVHLANSEMIADEAYRMRNCIRGYGYDVAHCGVELWSLRKDGGSIATMSIGPSYDDGLATITEIKAADNKKVGRDIALVARQWLQLQNIAAIEFQTSDEQARECEKAWLALFKSYWIEKRAVPRWPRLTPRHYQLSKPWLSKRSSW